MGFKLSNWGDNTLTCLQMNPKCSMTFFGTCSRTCRYNTAFSELKMHHILTSVASWVTNIQLANIHACGETNKKELDIKMPACTHQQGYICLQICGGCDNIITCHRLWESCGAGVARQQGIEARGQRKEKERFPFCTTPEWGDIYYHWLAEELVQRKYFFLTWHASNLWNSLPYKTGKKCKS